MLLEFDGTFIFALISFIVFVTLMNLILYRPVTKIINERQKFYDKNSKMALESKQKAEDVIKNKEAEILNTKLEASKILSSAQESAKSNKETALGAKKNEVQNKLRLNNEALIKNKDAVVSELADENSINTYVNAAVAKVLGEG